MTDSFGSSSDQDGQNTGEAFGDNQDQGNTQDAPTITAEELAALKNRDVNAQTHIPKIEKENEDLRREVEKLRNDLSSATTIDEVMARLDNSGSSDPVSIDPNKVADQVEQRLQQKAAEQVAEDNWNEVYSKLTSTYGEWSKADTEISNRASQLNMSLTDATALAKRSPSAFYELFLPKEGTPSQSSAASAAGQKTSSHTDTSQSRDRAWYSALRKENPNKYWSAEVQAQYRRDIHGAN